MKHPHDLSGKELARLLRGYGYEITRQTASHMRLTSKKSGTEHHVTIPAHKQLTIGTLGAILTEVAAYLEIERNTLVQELFNE